MKTLSSTSGRLARVLLLSRRKGFALIVTLTMMILLTVVAVGLLTLSAISLRGASQSDANQIARANARMALMLAIGDLQKQLGPDQRISALADQRPSGSDGSQTSANAKRRQWTGVYRSWPSTTTTRPTPDFFSWLVSGDYATVSKVASADAAPGTDEVELVGSGTLGSTSNSRVSAPAIKVGRSGSSTARMAWWVGDQGVKAAISTPPVAIDTSFASRRQNLQGAPRNAAELASIGTNKPFGALAPDDARTALVSDWSQASFLASDVKAPQELFHDLAPFSSGLLTNVTAGGFRKDLSMQLERPSANAPTTALYTVGGESGINLQELWAYYNLYKDVRKSGGPNYTTGGRVPTAGPYLQLESTPLDCQNDDEFYMKMPVIISYQLVLSFRTFPVQVGANLVNRLHVVADPVLTFWNPLDVPVVVPQGTTFSVKWWQIPYDLFISRRGGPFQRYPLAATFSNDTTTSNGDANFLSLQVGGLQQMVFKPGEVIKMSQSGNTVARAAVPDIHKLGGRSGFNYGSGVAMPVRDLAGSFLDLAATDTILYRATANNLTAGKTSQSGNSSSGANQHTRHFSLSHHEFYVGDDRGSASNSLGIGGMFIDWDFGNKRLQATDDRGQTAPGIAGTKPSSSRLYANNFPNIFRPILEKDGREITAAEISANKAPFMMVSYNAKTENSSDLGTRTLSRFNPKALHVDFYDLTQAERDLLPYEFVIEPLTSWKNRNLEVTTTGNAYFGGGLNAEFGANFVTTHSVPREPIVSLAAFQHSFANGFNMQKPRYGYATINAREPMMPQISHAIGNSMACPIFAPDRSESTLAGGRPAADHSYLANRALWDEWFLSGITPQTNGNFSKSRTQRIVASEFLTGKARLPTVRYSPDLHGLDATKLANTYFAGASPSDAATREIAALISVDGMFNVNSTSIEAWKCLLGGLRNRPIIVRDATGAEIISTADANTPVANLQAPQAGIARGTGSVAPKDPDQWVGRRTLTEAEIDALARALVKEVRKRGPFLSLADFVNRRLSTNKDLARAGTIQSALDAPETRINDSYVSGSRAVATTTSSRFTFPEAERGPMSFGSPGIVKQADILTPIAPVLSARSDSFIVRAYGEALDRSGNVTARAWCEAIVQRGCEFVDPTDAAEKVITSISNLNRFFGRRFKLVSFRWLNPSEV